MAGRLRASVRSPRRTLTLPRDWKTAEYGSHWHLVTRVVEAFKPKHVLETGSGLYSTSLFLTFDIDQLVSIENDPEWAIQSNDPRHELVEVEGPIADHLPPLDEFDLVFVDDDPVDSRPETIRCVLSSAPGLVIVHDTDYWEFHALVSNRANYTDTDRAPHTTVLHPTDSKEFRKWLDTLSPELPVS